MQTFTRDQFVRLSGITLAAYKTDRRLGFLPGAVEPDSHHGPVVDDGLDRRHSRFSALHVIEYIASLEFRNRFSMTATKATAIAREAIGYAYTHHAEGDRAECFIGVLQHEERPVHFAGSPKKLAAALCRSDVDALVLVSLDACFDAVAKRAEAEGIPFPPDLSSAVLGHGRTDD